MKTKFDPAWPFGVSRDTLIQNDILRFEVATLEKANAMLEECVRERNKKIDSMEARVETMQAVLDNYALTLEK